MHTTYTLKPHIDNPVDDFSASVMVKRSTQFRWFLTYEISGDTQSIIIPDRAESRKGAKLWEETCCELFVRNPEGEYIEFNFSPSSQWSCFHFDRYRSGMRDLKLDNEPKMLIDVAPLLFRLEVSLDLVDVASFSSQGGSLFMALSVVIKMQDQRYCHYALGFPSGAPDFHHSAGFLGV